MPITAECSNCNRRYEAQDAWAGRHFRCPNCGATTAVPIPPGYERFASPSIHLPPPGYSIRPPEFSRERFTQLNEVADSSVEPEEAPARAGVSPGLLGAVAALLLLGGVAVAGAVFFAARLRAASFADSGGKSVVTAASLAEARANHATRLLQSAPSPQPYDNRVPPGVTVVKFPSDGRQLTAWLARPPGTGPFPAVLYAHGGFALGESDFADMQPFLAAGYVLLMPAWRGENGNPGSFEMCYGEVADAAAALDYLAAQSDVDPQRLFAVGHSVGGTIVMLLAEISPRLRGAMACGGCPDMQRIIELQRAPIFDVPTFDWRDPVEGDLRSPARHLKDLACPLSLFYGASGDETYLAQAHSMQANAAQLGKSVSVATIPGADHYSALTPAVRQAVIWFRSLEGNAGGN